MAAGAASWVNHSSANARLAADIGGTFTDIAVFDDKTGKIKFGKALSTPDRLVDGITAGVEKAGSSYADARLFLHGSTVAINTILERTGARTALVITAGLSRHLRDRPHQPAGCLQSLFQEARAADRARAAFRDRANASCPTARSTRRSTRPKSRRWRGISAGSASRRRRSCFSTATAMPTTKRAPSAIIERINPDMFVSASHELSQEYREFERCSTVAANAYIGPIVRRYIGEIEDHAKAAGFGGSLLIVQSTGGLYEAAQAKSQCVRMLESGPAAGVIGTQALCHTLGLDQAIAFDMGGTTAKAGVIVGGEAMTTGQCADRRLQSGAAGADRHDGYFRGRHRRRLDRAGRGRRRAACRPAQRRRGAGTGLLRPRRHRADRDRRQSGAGPARRRPLPWRRDEARCRGGRNGAARQGRASRSA